MSDMDDVIRLNPEAAKELKKVEETLELLKRLRTAGIAKGVPALVPPHSGRYDEIPQSRKRATISTKAK